MTLRDGLARSKNMISIRSLSTTRDYLARFWLRPPQNPHLTMASRPAPPPPGRYGGWQVFANGGYRSIPRGSGMGRRWPPDRVPTRWWPGGALRVIDARNAWLMD